MPMARKIDPQNCTNVERAAQAYMILVGHAHRFQLITYKRLAKLMGYEAKGRYQFLGDKLDPIMRWCEFNSMPPLTSIVVKEATGEPGQGLKNFTPISQERLMQVFKFDWYAYLPPTPKQLKAILETEDDEAA